MSWLILIWEKFISILVGNLNSGRSYLITTVTKIKRDLTTRWWSGLILIADVADFVSDGESHVLQNSIYVAMATSVAVTFLDPIANVQGLACLAWANKVNWNTEKHQLIPRLISTRNHVDIFYLLCTINQGWTTV